MSEYHEPYEALSPEMRNRHRAIASLREELEAVDWYAQRVDVCDDEELRAVLLHNLNEELEHAMMTLEWLRRRMPVLDQVARRYLFTQGDITEIEERAESSSDEQESSLGLAGLGGGRR
ncbi:MAG TPA: ferritin-like domain-containing protein [Kofleriaceae bacterium]|nr:ferritin-like domain-containing protein [Kofleriaceae bacterium]